jgi:hypothetical protein
MAAKFDLNDDSVVVVVGSGAAAVRSLPIWPSKASRSSASRLASGTRSRTSSMTSGPRSASSPGVTCA